MAGIDLTQKLYRDCLSQIYAYLDTSTLRSLRTMSRQSSEVASEYLFHTIYIRPDRDNLDIVAQISQNAIFAGGVREIVWETARYVDPLIPLDRHIVAEKGGDDSQPHHGAAGKEKASHDIEWETLGSSEDFWGARRRERIYAACLETSAERMAKLVAALRKFTGLRHMTLCSWARRMRTLKTLWAAYVSSGPGDDGVFQVPD